jgi:hypothetical protein
MMAGFDAGLLPFALRAILVCMENPHTSGCDKWTWRMTVRPRLYGGRGPADVVRPDHVHRRLRRGPPVILPPALSSVWRTPC